MKVRQDFPKASRDLLAPAQNVPSFRERLHLKPPKLFLSYRPIKNQVTVQAQCRVTTAYSLGPASSFFL